MSIIGLFRNYIEEHHPHLAEKEWIVDVRTLSATEIRNKEVKAMISNESKEELKCWIFYYNSGASNVVYLLQDKHGSRYIGMGLLREGELVNPISFI
ncbi:hypothetical protein PDK45_25160 [Bacillus cereus]|nr:hypothetical protein [Bacillus cereus]